jgi:SAM-dependent methyltransferase
MNNISELSIKNWFDKLYVKKRYKSMRPPAAYTIFLDYLKVKKGDKLLDIGCGTGYLLKAGSERGLKVFGIDVSPEAIKLSKKVAPQLELVVGSVKNLPLSDNYFDFLTCIGVFEHFINQKCAVYEMRRVAKPNACFCMMVPNSETMYWKFAQKFRQSFKESNENAYSLLKWKEIFQFSGFKILHIYRDDWRMRKFLNMIGVSRFKFILKFIQKLNRIFIPLNYAHQFIFIMSIEK